MKYNNLLIETANNMVQKGKGILAADESNPTCGKRFDSIGVESSFENRNEYRDMLFSAEGIEKYISGVIMFDETFRQTTTCDQKINFPEYLSSKGIIPGIKVDTGAKDLAGFKNEKITEGLDGLRERLVEYFNLGARFAKWRAVINIDDTLPSLGAIEANTHALARYAALCQENGIVPIVEPEVLMDGSHDINRCYEVSCQTLDILFDQLSRLNVMLEGIVLKPNMIISGLSCSNQASIDEVSNLTVKCFKEHVPDKVAGIAFLSGGQSSDIATEHLNAMNKNHSDLKWNLSFSYGRALQHNALNAWSGKNREDGQKKLMERAKNNSLATMGKF
ncbi:MAG: fructose-bisphosphate aldolase [bacterium TMED6]|nr:MAG: fructose-bisphosphate aldolase [bacterium TMED6]|tara:strand:+ start:3946 stop:4947 length:1002 start_codon:yes stop_codon:yes gene_type:complete